MSKPLTKEQALDHYTELMRRVSVGAYEERDSEHWDTGTWPDDGVEESINNLDVWAEKQGLEFCWNQDSKTWSLEPISGDEQ